MKSKTSKLRYPKTSKGVSTNLKSKKVVKKKHTKQVAYKKPTTRRMYNGYEVITMSSKVPYGKYKELTMEQLMGTDFKYFKWLLTTLKNKVDFSNIGKVKVVEGKTSFINSTNILFWE